MGNPDAKLGALPRSVKTRNIPRPQRELLRQRGAGFSKVDGWELIVDSESPGAGGSPKQEQPSRKRNKSQAGSKGMTSLRPIVKMGFILICAAFVTAGAGLKMLAEPGKPCRPWL